MPNLSRPNAYAALHLAGYDPKVIKVRGLGK
jgi:hypothetical protein